MLALSNRIQWPRKSFFAGPVPQKPPTNYELSSRLLSLSISLDTLEGMLENELTPPEVIDRFLT